MYNRNYMWIMNKSQEKILCKFQFLMNKTTHYNRNEHKRMWTYIDYVIECITKWDMKKSKPTKLMFNSFLIVFKAL